MVFFALASRRSGAILWSWFFFPLGTAALAAFLPINHSRMIFKLRAIFVLLGVEVVMEIPEAVEKMSLSVSMGAIRRSQSLSAQSNHHARHLGP